MAEDNRNTGKSTGMNTELDRLMQQGIDSRAMFATYITKLPVLLLLAVAGAVLGSGLHLLITFAGAREPVYVSETEYYISFTRYDVRDVYNAFTWNDVIATDSILGKAMEILGSGYDRNDVKEMITAEILSDVRYLTIKIRGQDPERVERVKNVIGTVLVEFADEKEEFQSIEKIEDLELVQEKVQYFTWRAAFLGAVIFSAVGIFVVALKGSMGSVFYSKNDIVKILALPALGVAFSEKHKNNYNNSNNNSSNNRKKTGGFFADKQWNMLAANLKLMLKKYSVVTLMDASDGLYAAEFQKYIRDNGFTEMSGVKICGAEGYDSAENAVIIAVIPFGKVYREKITDEINLVRLHGGTVAAAVLTGADKIWTDIYYGRNGDVL